MALVLFEKDLQTILALLRYCTELALDLSFPIMVFPRLVLAVSAMVAGVLADNWPKRGLAANDDVPIWQFGGEWLGHPSEINWQYNWDSTTNQKQSFAEFVPMLWGTQDYHTRQWWDNAWYWLNNGGSGHLLAFNEPDRPDQSHMSVSEAVARWKQYMEPFAGHAQLGAPAVSNAGFDWINQFLQQCDGCHIDFVPVHWYNDASLEWDFENWVNKICSISGGRQVWITEVCFELSCFNCFTYLTTFLVPSHRLHRPAKRVLAQGHPVP